MKVERVKVHQFSCHTENISLIAITIIVTVSSPLLGSIVSHFCENNNLLSPTSQVHALELTISLIPCYIAVNTRHHKMTKDKQTVKSCNKK